MRIRPLRESDLDSLQPLVEEFVRTHRSLPFSNDYQQAFRDQLEKGINDGNSLPLLATLDGQSVGFIIGDVRENAPFLLPDRIGHVGILVVAEKARNKGVGNALWNELRNGFRAKGANYFEVYTEYGNPLSGPFWNKRGFKTFLEKRRLGSRDC